MNIFFELIKELKQDNPKEAEELLDLYTNEVFTWWGNWHEDKQNEVLEEYKEFYDLMNFPYPFCIHEVD